MNKQVELSSLTHSPFVVSQYGKEKKYWMNKISEDFVRSSFPYDHHSRKGVNFGTSLSEVDIRFSNDLSSQLIKLGTGKDSRIHVVLQALLALLLMEYTGNSDIIVATPIYKQEKEVRFINTVLPLCYHIPREGNVTFKELLKQVRQTIADAVENQNYPMDTLVYQMDLSYPEGEFPFSDVALLMMNIHEERYLEHVDCNIRFIFSRENDDLIGKMMYNPLRYDKSTVECISAHFIRYAEATLNDIERKINNLNILTLEEKKKLVFDFNNNMAEYPKDETLGRLLHKQVLDSPDRIAIIDLWTQKESKSKDPRHFTYRQLYEKVSSLASLLVDKGIRPDSIVALYVKHRSQLIIAKLAVIVAGGGYVTIDPQYPEDRIRFILKDSHTGLLLKEAGTGLMLPRVDGLEVLEFDDLTLNDSPDLNEILSRSNPSDLAYILYTSGSTGGPKGVMLEHRNIVRLVLNSNHVPFSSQTRMLQNSSPVFDVVTWEIWGALLNGGQLILAERDLIMNASLLEDALKRYLINIALFTPVFFNQLAHQNSKMFGALEWLLVGGDILSPSHINQVRHDNKHLNVINAYGPTENATLSTTYLIEKDYETAIPIGHPINQSTAYVLDSHLRLQPIGVIGELCVGGDGVARGYMNNPELTADKFVQLDALDFYSSQLKDKKIYKTGDLARWRSDGVIEFFGRKDYQVKVLGHRIELGEIENQMLKHNEINDVAAILTGDRAHPILCAYYVSEKDVKPAMVKDYLKDRLPDYMIPSHFIQMEKLPYTPTGKIDRKVLPDPKTAATASNEFLPPTNDFEKTILDIWADALELDPKTISILDDFFSLGGNSINILKIKHKLDHAFQQDISMSSLFLHPTIKELATELSNKSKQKQLKYIVKLNNGNNKKNIFIFHQLNGMIYAYKEFAELLESQFNIYGVQAKGMTEEEALPKTTEEMISDYLPEIMEIQPKGPYILSGYCIGNALAYETARAMEEKGEEVSQLLLIDVGSSMPEKAGFLEKMRIYFERFLYALHVAVRDPKSLTRKEGEDETQQQLIKRVKANNMRVVSLGYKYKKIVNAPIIHIRAEKNLSQRLFQRTWAKMTRSHARFFKIPGHHFNIFEHPNVDRLLKIVRGNL